MNALIPHQFHISSPTQIPPIPTFPNSSPTLRNPLNPTLHRLPHPAKTNATGAANSGIPSNQVKTLARFQSLHNHIRVLEVSRRADHSLAGSRLLLLDRPGNIHSISFLLRPFTSTYFDVFATLPPILPPGPVAILGFGAGSAARLLLHLHPHLHIHGWEIDPSVVAVARRFFGLEKLERQHRPNLFVHVGDALGDEVACGEGFAGIFVDLFHKGSLLPELQELDTWKGLRRKLRKGGRVMVNCGGDCVEAEELERNGEKVMGETLRSMQAGFGAREVFVLKLGHGSGEPCVAMTGPWPEETEAWKRGMPEPLRGYVDHWTPFIG